eukprot:gene28426-37366_t
MTLRPTLTPSRHPTMQPSVIPSNPPQSSQSLTASFTDWILSNQIIVGALIIVFFMLISICLYFGIRDVKRRRLEAFSKSNSNHSAVENEDEHVDYAGEKLADDHKEIMKNISHDIPYEDIYGRKSKSWDENVAEQTFNGLNQKTFKEEFLKQYKENIELRSESSTFTEPSIDPAIFPLAKSDNLLSHAQLERLIIATKFLQEENISFQHANRFYNSKVNSTENNRTGRFFPSKETLTTTNRGKNVNGPSADFAAAPESNLKNLLSKFSTISNVNKSSPPSAAGSTSDNDLNSVGKSNSKEEAPTSKSSDDHLETESGYNWPQETPRRDAGGQAEESNSSLYNLVQRLSSTLANPYSPLIATEGLNMDLELSREEVRPVDYAVHESSPTASGIRSRSNSTDSASRIHKLRQSQQRVQTAGQTVRPIVVGRSQKDEIDKLLNKTGNNNHKRLII